jgi:threonine/homoserine efflux transporter RhtA
MNAPSAALAHLLLAGWRMQRTVLSRIESRIYNVVTFHLSRQRNDSLHVHRTCSSMYVYIHPSIRCREQSELDTVGNINARSAAVLYVSLFVAGKRNGSSNAHGN